MNRDTNTRSDAWEWNPEPYDPPVQYAFVPENAECHSWFSRPEDEETEPPLITCTEWRLRVNYTRGRGNQSIGIPYAAGCGGYRGEASVGDDDCTSDIQLYDAASQVELSRSERRGMPLRVSRDGHRVAYLSKKYLQLVGWDLPSAQMKPISPRLDARALDDLRGVEISHDGEFFAVSFAGSQPRLLITEFSTGKTTTLPGFCGVLGLSNSASRIAAHKECSDDDLTPAGTVTILKRDGTVVGEWTGAQFVGNLSPDGRFLVAIHSSIGADDDEYLITHDAVTGKIIKKLRLRLLSEPSDAIGYAWLNKSEYIVQAETPEPGGSFGYYRVNVESGASRRIRDLGLNPGEAVSLGSVFIES